MSDAAVERSLVAGRWHPMGLTGALATAGHSLEVFSTLIQVSGNNIANAGTPGYVREVAEMRSNFPQKLGGLVIGTGVDIVGVRQKIDAFLETRIYRANADAKGALARSSIYTQMETVIGELGTGDLSSEISNFVAKLQDLVNQPEDTATRQLAVEQGVQFATYVGRLRERLSDLRSSQDVKVNDLVNEANTLIDQVSQLNPQIIALESAGLLQSDAGGLRDLRLTALSRLSEILPIKVVDHSSGAVDVFLGNDHLVLVNDVQHLDTRRIVDRNTAVDEVFVEGSLAPISGDRGELAGTIAGRDVVVGGFVDSLDTLTSNFIFEFNKLYSSGQGRSGYESVTGTTPVTDTAASLKSAGLPFTPEHGSFELKVVNTVTGLSTTHRIAVDLDGIGTDTSLTSLSTTIDALANVSASITSTKQLKLTAAAGYELTFADDTSGVLASLGINTFFTGSSSTDIGVNDLVKNDSDLFAASLGGGAGDGRNAQRLAAFVTQPLAGLTNLSVDQYYERLISSVGQSSAAEQALADGSDDFRDSLQNQREQQSGVSLDEEMLQILTFQRTYQVAARIISTVDSLFQTLLQL